MSFRNILLLSSYFIIQFNILSAQSDSTNNEIKLGLNTSITNNGISTIPNFTLGKPAVIFDFTVGNKFSFDPQFRFSLKGQPWSFIFWGHYQLIDEKRLSVRLGAHPAFLFSSEELITENDTNTVMVSKRYLAGQIRPEYSLTKNLKIGVQYLYSHGFEYNTAVHTHFITANTTIIFNKPENITLLIKPEIYYLKMDNANGKYFTTNVSVNINNFPVSVSAMFNKKLDSQIAGDNFLWSIILRYNLNKTFASNKH